MITCTYVPTLPARSAETKKNPCSDEGRTLKPGVTHKHISASCLDTALKVRLEQVHDKNNLPLVGHCTDSASNALGDY